MDSKNTAPNDGLLLQQKVHLVELDLLLAGTHPPHLRPLPEADYYAFISRADQRPDCQVYSWTVRDLLPTIPIPLKAPDADVHVDLGAVFRTAYQRGRYAPSLAYGKKPVAPVRKEDVKWAVALSARK